MARRRGKAEGEGQPKRRTPVGLRIIGGRLRGRRLLYDGSWSIRPMRDRVREAIFNILRDAVVDARVIDIFAGTGAMGLEALSRGAKFVQFIERDPTACRVLLQNIEKLQLKEQAEVIVNDAFVWWKHCGPLENAPHVVFCCPPYELYHTHGHDMLQLITGLIRALPNDSVLAVESGEDVDVHQFPYPDKWDMRLYRPSRIGFFWKTASGDTAA